MGGLVARAYLRDTAARRRARCHHRHAPRGQRARVDVPGNVAVADAPGQRLACGAAAPGRRRLAAADGLAVVVARLDGRAADVVAARRRRKHRAIRRRPQRAAGRPGGVARVAEQIRRRAGNAARTDARTTSAAPRGGPGGGRFDACCRRPGGRGAHSCSSTTSARLSRRPGDNHDVRPHPHIGLTTVTPPLRRRVMHRDSLGSGSDRARHDQLDERRARHRAFRADAGGPARDRVHRARDATVGCATAATARTPNRRSSNAYGGDSRIRRQPAVIVRSAPRSAAGRRGRRRRHAVFDVDAASQSAAGRCRVATAGSRSSSSTARVRGSNSRRTRWRCWRRGRRRACSPRRRARTSSSAASRSTGTASSGGTSCSTRTHRGGEGRLAAAAMGAVPGEQEFIPLP